MKDKRLMVKKKNFVGKKREMFVPKDIVQKKKKPFPSELLCGRGSVSDEHSTIFWRDTLQSQQHVSVAPA